MKALIIIIAIVIGWGGWMMFKDREPVYNEPVYNTPTSNTDTKVMSIEDYVKLNISELSAMDNAGEVLGGTFYVTDIEAENGTGTVSYEDGHNAYVADFTYSIDEESGITINSFKVRR